MKMNASLCALAMMSALPVLSQSALQVDKEKDSLAIAEQLYAQSLNQNLSAKEKLATLRQAMDLFARFVATYPKSKLVPRAEYLRATCLTELGMSSQANQLLQSIATRTKGEYAAAAAYKMGSHASAQQSWEGAARYYQIVVQQSQRADLCNDARFRLAKALQMQNRIADAQQLYEQVLVLPKLDKNIEAATLYSLAQLKTQEGSLQEAFDLYARFLKLPIKKDAATEGSAVLQMARLSSKLGRREESKTYYAQLSQMQGMSAYQGEAQLEQILSLYKAKNYNGILEFISKELSPMSDPRQQANRDLIIGQALTELKHYEEAEAYFESAESLLPYSATAMDAAYRRIVASQLSGKADCFMLAEQFLKRYPNNQETAQSPLNDLVRLLYANHMMYLDVEEAARQFEAIRLENIPVDVRSKTLYSKAWCLAKSPSGSVEAINVLDSYIKDYPSDESLPDAIVLRASCLVNEGRLQEALADFDAVIDQNPKSKVAAVSWQSAAQACASAKKIKKMIHYYEGLIQNCPMVKKVALAEAHFNLARAYYKDDIQKATQHFIEARKYDPERYAKTVDFNLVQCYFKQQKHEKLLKALTDLKGSSSKLYAELPASIFRWCGWIYYQNKDYVNAYTYLNASLNREQKETYKSVDGQTLQRPKVEPLVWKTLAKTCLELRLCEEGLVASQHYISMEEQPYRKAEGMRDMAQLLIGLNRCDESIKLSEEAIEMGVDGPLKSALFITIGDAYIKKKDFSAAAKFYGRTANIVSDKALKPIALYKIAKALELAGRMSEAEIYQNSLKKEFPDWTPSARLSVFFSDIKNDKKEEPSAAPVQKGLNE